MTGGGRLGNLTHHTYELQSKHIVFPLRTLLAVLYITLYIIPFEESSLN